MNKLCYLKLTPISEEGKEPVKQVFLMLPEAVLGLGPAFQPLWIKSYGV